VFPILSRNRFFGILNAIAIPPEGKEKQGFKQITIQLSWPADEVGNRLGTQRMLGSREPLGSGAVFNENEFRVFFGISEHEATGVDYIKLYKSLGKHIKIIFSNDPRAILGHTDEVLAADIHTRAETKRELLDAGATTVIGLDDLVTESVNGSGWNQEYGLLGSNFATNGKLKLFPRDCMEFIGEVQDDLYTLSGKDVEVMIFGDGAFKCPVTGIWELADPVVSPGYSKGLEGTPNELKLKFLIDNLSTMGKSRNEVYNEIQKQIREKEATANQLGTTPRKRVDQIGSLADLLCGSGDRGTPLILIQGYFNNYAQKKRGA